MISFDGRRSPLGLQRLIKGLVILLAIVLAGTLGYRILEGWKILESLYMTVITITTVGFGEVRAVSEAGRVFTIFLIFSGMGFIAYVLGMLGQAIVDLQVRSILGRRQLGMKIRSMKDHYIICGFGRIGKIVTRELKANKIPLVVIDNNPDERLNVENEDVPYINDDATSEEVLLEAGIERAKGLISVVASDADNVFITMSARGLNPELFILARADEEQTEKKLLRAGANRVALPYLIGGQKMAHSIVKPAVTDFLEHTVDNKEIGLEMAELLVSEESPLNGATLIESEIRQDMDVIIVAIRKSDGEMTFNPSSQTRIEAGDILISLGTSDNVNKLARILARKE